MIQIQQRHDSDEFFLASDHFHELVIVGFGLEMSRKMFEIFRMQHFTVSICPEFYNFPTNLFRRVLCNPFTFKLWLSDCKYNEMEPIVHKAVKDFPVFFSESAFRT